MSTAGRSLGIVVPVMYQTFFRQIVTLILLAGFILGFAEELHAEEAPVWGLSAGAGLYSLSTTSSQEISKSGQVFPVESFLRRHYHGSISYALSVGPSVMNLVGSNSGVSQNIFQVSLTSDNSIFYDLSEFSIGGGIRHFIGPGNGLEYINPNAGVWALYAGPRATYLGRESSFYYQISWDMSLNLGVGHGQYWMFSLGYLIGKPPVVIERTQMAETVSNNEPEEKKPEEKKPEEPVLQVPKEKTNSFEFAGQMLALNFTGDRLIARTKTFFNGLAYDLNEQHKNEWDKVELRCPGVRTCSVFQSYLLSVGFPPSRIKIGEPAPNSRLIVYSRSQAMIGFLETKESQWKLRQHLLLKTQYSVKLEHELAAAFKALAENSSSWKNLTCFLPAGSGSNGARNLVLKLVRRYGLESVDFTQSVDSSIRVEIETL